MKCPNCGFESHAGMRFCGQCGAQLGSPCPSCGFTNPLIYRFCGMCGVALTDVAGAPGPFATASAAQLSLPLDAPAPALLPGLNADEAPPRVQHSSPIPARTEAPAPAPGPPARGLLAPLAGERRIATIILADVCDSTDLMEQLGTEAWVEMMNRVLQLLAAEVYRFGGHVDQFRGDGLVAFFGATHSHEDDPERAILAALAMHEALRPLAEEVLSESIDLKVRVGVNTGEVIVGSVGEAGKHREDTAMGEGVALAARMETAAEPGTVLVSAHTYHLAASRFEWQPLGEISVKGISRPIVVYRPLRLRSLTEARQARDPGMPLVAGRDEPLETLRSCVTAVQQGRGGIALVTGAKGMGKTQLINHVRRHFEQASGLPAGTVAPEKPGPPVPGITWLLGHCRSYDQSTPYSLWMGLLHNWLETAGADADSTEPSADLSTLLYRQAELLWGDDVERYYPYLAMLLSLPVEGPQARRITYLKAEGLQKQIFSTVYSWVEALAQRSPLVMTLSDLQFADSSSLELLRHCLPICESAAVLWLASFRPERTSPVWQFRHDVETEYPHRLTVIDLPPLTPSETRSLIEQMLGHGTLADATMALLIEKSEGNPYYSRELVYALIDQGLVQQDAAGVWRQMQPIQSFNLPGSLRGLLLTRIDHLSAEERHVLQIAAVTGPLFWRSVLEGLVDDPAQLKRCLTNLQRAQLVHEQHLEPELGIAYAFTPSMVRDVVYESLLNAQRTAYHLQIGEQIEQIVSPGEHPHLSRAAGLPLPPGRQLPAGTLSCAGRSGGDAPCLRQHRRPRPLYPRPGAT
jgi:class 3 adenylate cyclase